MDKDEEKGSSKRISISDVKDYTSPNNSTSSISDRFAKLAKSNPSLFNLTSKLPNFDSVFPNTDKLTSALKFDSRSQFEINEEYEQRLASIDVDVINRLIDKLKFIEKKLEDDDDSTYKLFQINRDALTILLRHQKDFERHTNELEQRLRYKQREVDIEKRADWAAKFRLFFFRTLGAVLLVVTLFSIGFIEHNYEWARLPLSAYLKPDTSKNAAYVAPAIDSSKISSD